MTAERDRPLWASRSPRVFADCRSAACCAPTKGKNAAHHAARQDSEHRHHGPHRCRENDYDRAHPVLHRPDLQAGRSPRWHRHDGLDGAGAGARDHHHLRRHHRLLAPPRPPAPHQHHRHPRARGLHRRGGAFPPGVGRRYYRARRGGRRRAANRDRVAPGRSLPRPAHRLREQDGPGGGGLQMCVKMVRERLGANVVPVHLPLGAGELFTGIIDLIREVEIVYDDESLGKKYVEGPVPAALKDKVKEMRHHLLEAIVEQDDAILHKYLEEHELSEEEIRTVLRKATISGKVVSVLAGAAFKNKGVQALLDAVVDYLPAPVDVPAIQGHLPHHDATHALRKAADEEPFSALAFKIMTDPYVGKLTFFRVYSGVLAAGSYIYNSTKDKKERIGRLLQMH